MLTATQTATAQAIVNIFETNSVLGRYGDVTVAANDPGHMSFGRSQASLASGNLGALVGQYCNNTGARFGRYLIEWLPRLQAKDLSLDGDNRFQNFLRATADDPVMRDTQDSFFEQGFWQPAEQAAAQLGIASALGVGVVYDSFVQGGWNEVRNLTEQQSGSPQAMGENAWIAAYIAARRQWLAQSVHPIVQATVYRMDAFARLVDQNHWGLDLPLVVRGVEISTTSLNATPPGCYDGPQPGARSLSIQTPLASGLDVRLLQLGLSVSGIDMVADGVFGQHTSECLRTYQTGQGGAPATGVADAALIARLGNF
jgi:chitosanase